MLSLPAGLSPLIALSKIMGINVLLSGDNAVVIALSCRTLPRRQRMAAIAFGTSAAIVFRIAFTALASFLLTFPYLKAAGSLLLFWVALKLLLPEPGEGGDVENCGKLFAAIRTIVLADLVMSLDNVIGVAAAANGSLLLLTLGLILSMPVIIFGSTIMLKAFGRFPFLVTLGAALIGYIAGELCFSEPLIHQWIESNFSPLLALGPLMAAFSVVLSGKLWHTRNKRESLNPAGEPNRKPQSTSRSTDRGRIQF
jgi:YjbE family integral membrane protein